MSNKRSSTLFTLIKSLSKSEKRYFKLSESRNSDKKYLRLFELIENQKVFDEEVILDSEPLFKRSQFSNLKAHLYSKILRSLRDFSLPSISGVQIREFIDEAQILFNKSLYQQSSLRLNKAFSLASETDNLELQLEILKWKKQVLTHTVGWGNQEYVNEIINEVRAVNAQINNINKFSNLQSQLQSLYQKTGYIRNEKEFRKIEKIFLSNLPEVNEEEISITEKIHLYQLYIGYYFFIQDFQSGYYIARKWVNIFHTNKALLRPKLEWYISGLNYLLIAEYKLLQYDQFQETKKELRFLNKLPKSFYNENIRLKLLKYSFVHEFNSLFLGGEFERGVALIERLSSGLEGFINQLDAHSRVILFYKTACLYFGAGDFKKSLEWLNKIMTLKESDLREDIHGFARILTLISHYELENIELIQYYVRSTYRFLSKKKDLHQFQKLILRFLKELGPQLSQKDVISRFESLKEKMLLLKSDPYENRAFVYFDIIIWLDSKIRECSMKEIYKEKGHSRGFV
jgi:hypothetical protein